MSISAVQSGRLAWLMVTLADKRARVAGLLRRLSGMGPAGAVAPKLFGKFLDLLDEVAAATSEETGILSRIEAIEQKHRFMRAHKKLKIAAPRLVMLPAALMPAKAKRSPLELWLFLILWYLVLRPLPRLKINQKKQGLTVD